jgi:anti-sigma factor RsiW
MTTAHELICQEIVEVITDYLEGAMDAGLHAAFEAHLTGCPHCRHYVEQMRAMIRVSGTIEAESLTPEFRTGLEGAFRDWRQA